MHTFYSKVVSLSFNHFTKSCSERRHENRLWSKLYCLPTVCTECRQSVQNADSLYRMPTVCTKFQQSVQSVECCQSEQNSECRQSVHKSDGLYKMPTVGTQCRMPTVRTEYRLVGLVVRRPPRERKIPGSNPACAGIFSGSSHTSDSKIGTPVATLPGAWRYRVSAGTGRPGVSIL